MHAGYNRLNTRERGKGMQLVQVIICHISTHSGGRAGRGARGRIRKDITLFHDANYDRTCDGKEWSSTHITACKDNRLGTRKADTTRLQRQSLPAKGIIRRMAKSFIYHLSIVELNEVLQRSTILSPAMSNVVQYYDINGSV